MYTADNGKYALEICMYLSMTIVRFVYMDDDETKKFSECVNNVNIKEVYESDFKGNRNENYML